MYIAKLHTLPGFMLIKNGDATTFVNRHIFRVPIRYLLWTKTARFHRNISFSRIPINEEHLICLFNPPYKCCSCFGINSNKCATGDKDRKHNRCHTLHDSAVNRMIRLPFQFFDFLFKLNRKDMLGFRIIRFLQAGHIYLTGSGSSCAKHFVRNHNSPPPSL